MKLSYNWLNEFIKIDDIDPEEIGLKLTMCTSEIESVEGIGGNLKKIVVGKILQVKPHPDSSHLFLTKIDVGGEVLDIISGAPNTTQDTFVPVAPLGTQLPGGNTVKKVKIRGVESYGVVCSEMELGISDDHTGLWLLNEEGPVSDRLKPGTPLEKVFPTKDYIVEIDNKSLTNRPDLWGHYGFVRELAAIYGRKPKPVYSPGEIDAVLRAKGDKTIAIEIENEDLCPRYSAIRLGGIRVKKSPYLLRRRLSTLGVRPISNIVDITNYVMLLTGQPLHAFDAQRIADSRIIVRCARRNERVTTLDDIERNTDQQVLLITDPKKAVAIAGVMGGANSEIDDNTDEIIIEAANFNPVNIRRTALRMGLRTEASNRFEKSLDPELTIFGLTGCVTMIRKLLSDSSILSPFADAYPGQRRRNVVRLNCDWASTLIGASIKKKQIVSILRSLQFDVDDSKGADIEVTVPTFRSTKDVSIPQDLVEEVGRIYGYDNITPALPHIESTPSQRDEILYFTRELKTKLSGELSLTEVYTYSFLDDALLRLFYENGEDTFVTLKNPVSTEMSRMRRSLVCGLFGLLQKNSPFQDEFSLFEIGSVYTPRQSSKRTDDGLPHERCMVSALMIQKIEKGSVFFELKGKAELLFKTLGLYGVSFKPFDSLGDYHKRFDIGAVGLDSTFHPGRRAIVCHGDTCFGVVAEMNPKLLKKVGMDFHVYRVSLFEMDVQLLYDRVRFGRENKKYAALARFPEVVLAFAVVVDEKVPAQEVREFIASYDSNLIEQVELFDIYRGKSLPDGKKNLAFNVSYRRKDRTLTEKEAKVVHEEIARRVRKHGWELR